MCKVALCIVRFTAPELSNTYLEDGSRVISMREASEFCKYGEWSDTHMRCINSSLFSLASSPESAWQASRLGKCGCGNGQVQLRVEP